MKNNRFGLVILDATGNSRRRLSVSRTQLKIAVSVVVVALVAMLFVIGSGLKMARSANQAQRLVRENASLTQVLAQLEQSLPHAVAQEARLQLGFSQLWKKSVAQSASHASLVKQAGADQEADDTKATPPAALLRAEPAGLSKEVERLEHESVQTLFALNELLDYFHDARKLLSNTPSVRPVANGWLTSRFGKRRDPFHARFVVHKGVDFAGYTGMEIFAPADGVVIWAGVRGGYGRTVVIDHGFGIQSHFAHLNRYTVTPGDRVHRGDRIAEMGSTGRSTGPHLHYEVRRFGRPLDPISFILD